MNTPQHLTLLVAIILVHAAVAFPTDKRAVAGRDKKAAWEDMNVMAHGLLQLGQALKEHVDKTKAQMRDVNGRLKAFNFTVAELERKQLERDEALQARNKGVEEEREKPVARPAVEASGRAEEVKAQSDDIHSRMDRLEEKVDAVLKGPALVSNHSDHTGVPFIQRLVAAQNRRIDQLVEKIKQQQEKLEKQSLHLQTLQIKVAQKRIKSHRRRDEETALRGEPQEPSRDASGLARDCHHLFLRGKQVSGVYKIQPQNSQPFNVFCEMTSEGGWTVIQKRHDGSENFNQLWESYKKGFGNLEGEFWLGLENIWALSSQGQHVLQVELSDCAGERQHEARYRFRLEGEEKKFALHLEQEASSGAQEIITTPKESGLPFSTADRDNDLASDVNCAALLSGGWWFSDCGGSNLNGRYPRRQCALRRQPSRRRALFWTSTRGRDAPLRGTLLKIAPATIKQ